MKVEFFYDISCPFAYQASILLARSKLIPPDSIAYVPALLGAIFRETKAPQGKDGIASDLMSPARKKIHDADFNRLIRRNNIELKWPSNHPQRTVNALRTLIMLPENERRLLTDALFRAYWVENRNVADDAVLADVFATTLKRPMLPITDVAKEALRTSTQRIIDAGAFGVPSFIVGGQLYFGSDRLHLVESHFSSSAAQPRLAPTWDGKKRKLTFYFDVTSPFTYLASTQISKMVAESHSELELVPILLGAVFQDIGSASVPLFTFPQAKAAYYAKDLEDWRRFWKLPDPVRFPDAFPLRTITAQRVVIVEPATMDCLFEAGWVKNQNIGDDAVLLEVLNSHGFDGTALIAATKAQDVKDRLRTNTERAVAAGVCGLPSFQVDGQDVIFGQDRLNVIADLLNGWS